MATELTTAVAAPSVAPECVPVVVFFFFVLFDVLVVFEVFDNRLKCNFVASTEQFHFFVQVVAEASVAHTMAAPHLISAFWYSAPTCLHAPTDANWYSAPSFPPTFFDVQSLLEYSVRFTVES